MLDWIESHAAILGRIAFDWIIQDNRRMRHYYEQAGFLSVVKSMRSIDPLGTLHLQRYEKFLRTKNAQ
jgi:hypothetical protein